MAKGIKSESITFSELAKTQLKQAEYTVQLSKVLLQSGGANLNGENKQSGDYCEEFVRSFLRKNISSRFRVVSGFIATKKALKQNKKLLQCDCLIVDNLIPPLFKFDGTEIEVVPVESVLGIIEIKRTLNAIQYKKALNHLENIAKESGIIKNDDTNILFGNKVLNGLSTGFRCNPITGIIALNSTKPENYIPNLADKVDSKIDFIYTFNGTLRLPGTINKNVVKAKLENERSDNLVWWCESKKLPSKALMKFIGYFNLYLMNSSCLVETEKLGDNYWFNENLYNKLK